MTDIPEITMDEILLVGQVTVAVQGLLKGVGLFTELGAAYLALQDKLDQAISEAKASGNNEPHTSDHEVVGCARRVEDAIYAIADWTATA
jgi:hypothetical protein